MWLIANSREGLASSTTALPSARIRLSSAVDTSAVFAPGLPITAESMQGRQHEVVFVRQR